MKGQHKRIIFGKRRGHPYLLSKATLAALTAILCIMIIEWKGNLFTSGFREGDIALRDIYAPYDFSIKGEIDTKATEELRKKAYLSVRPICIIDRDSEEKVLKKLESFRGELESLKKMQIGDEERLSKVKNISTEFNLSETIVQDILGLKDFDGFFELVKKILVQFIDKGVISGQDYSTLKQSDIDTLTLIDPITKLEKPKKLDDFFRLDELRKNLEPAISSFIKDRKDKQIFLDLISAILVNNIRYDANQTELKRQEAAQAVQPVYTIVDVKKNEVILNKGERIQRSHIEKLKVIEEKELSFFRFVEVFGISILVILFVLLVSLYIRYFEPEVNSSIKELVLISTVSILLVATAKIIVFSPWPSSLVPVAVGSMLVAILVNGRLAIVLTIFLSVLVGMMAGERLDILGLSLVAGIVGTFSMRDVKRRSQLITAGLAVGLANMSYLIGISLLRSFELKTGIIESLLGLANGIISAIIVTGILPIFENIFKIPTNISLLELADLNHPILKKMVIEAPGTYHHSLVVGNLAESACEAIGANYLLARVASYFHDIGKIEKAPYFSENQSPDGSAHDKLSPTMSSLIITNHVKNGVELAERYRLNKKIVDIIRQHHGTGLVFYFYKKAVETGVEEEVGEQSFRYSGPKPQTKEAACVLLADSVEAASRTLDDPTPARIKGLVRKVINTKFIDGQLDECDLTLKDLEKISEVFTHILTGIFHKRVEYPEEAQEKKNKK